MRILELLDPFTNVRPERLAHATMSQVTHRRTQIIKAAKHHPEKYVMPSHALSPDNQQKLFLPVQLFTI
ncbi:MAG TPA: hypothetical protein VIX17_12250 [Pyrinomonadaceae bacterium]